jgi:hypothetical protein
LANQVCSHSDDNGLDSTIDVWRNTVIKTLEECEALGTDKAHLTPIAAMVERVIEAGLGSKELGILFEQMITRKE